MTCYAGVDSGSWNTKVAVIDAEARVLGTAVVRSGADLGTAAEQAYAIALARSGRSRAEITAVWATGFGRQSVRFAHGSRTELDCHGRGAAFYVKGPLVLIDIGGQDAKVIRLGIGDVTRPLAPAVIEAFHKAVDDLATTQNFAGYGPEQGYDWLINAIIEKSYKPLGVSLKTEEMFISDGSKCDCANILDIFALDNVVAIGDPVYPVYNDTNVMIGRTGEADAKGDHRLAMAFAVAALGASGPLSASGPGAAGSGPTMPTVIAGCRSVICLTSGSSASNGKLGMRSTSERTSPRIFCAFDPASNSSTTYPKPSLATEVCFLMPSTERTASSIFWQMPSSASSGLAPG